MFFRRNPGFFENLKKSIFLTFESEKKFKNYFFLKFFDFPENYDTSASIWYIYFGLTPNSLGDVLERNQGVHFFP